jgi:cytochrome c biogenesis protein CcmG/thiol:disulfide interchange protein DsbE
VLVAGLVLACVAVAGVLAVGIANQDTVDDPEPKAPSGIPTVAAFEPFPAPSIAGTVVSGAGAGGEASLASLEGKPVVVNFWASWCDPCRREAPELVSFAKDHPEVAMLGVNSNDAAAQARPFAEQHGFTWPSIEDGGGQLAERMCVIGLPCTFVVDPKGQVVYRHLGEIHREDLDAVVAHLS